VADARSGTQPHLARLRILAVAVVAAVGVSLIGATSAQAATKQLSVDLSTVTGPSIGVGQGILYGITADATQPSDDYLKPLNLNSFRGGGWFAGGWRGDGYQLGTKTQSEIDSIIAQAQRLKAASSNPDGFTYEVIVSDLWGSTGGAPANSQWPCNNGDCSNWVQFIQQAVGQLQASGINFSYDIWNEPDLSIFWSPGVNTAQYFQMWDVGYATLRSVAPGAAIVGPSFAYTPQRQPAEWTTFFAHVKAANTAPDWISNHNEGEGGVPLGADDPVVVSQLLRDDLDAAGLSQRPLSSNEYQGAGKQTADVTAWYINRLAQSSYTTAMRGNWNCCMIPNLTGLLTNAQTGWAPTGNWWAMRTSADMTGSLVASSNMVDTMSITAAKDDSKQQAVALLGDLNGYTGAANVTFTGLSSTPYLVRNGQVHATVYRIPEGTLYAPIVQFAGDLPVAADGSISVPTNFTGTHDAVSIYLSWSGPQTLAVQAPSSMTPGNSYDVPVVVTNSGGSAATGVATSLAVTASDPSKVQGIVVTCTAGGATCPTVSSLAPGASTTATYHVAIPASLPPAAYRLVGTSTFAIGGTSHTITNSVDLVAACGPEVNCEAENGQLAGGACTASNHPGYTGSGFVACFDTTASGRSVTQQFSVAKAGTYTLDLRYAAGPDGPAAQVARTATLTANGSSQQIQMPPTGSWNTWGVVTATLQLAAGTNNVSITKGAADNGWFNLDHLVLHAPDTEKPTATLVTPTTAGPFSSLTLQVDATDNRGLQRIVANIYQNGTLVKSTQTAVAGGSLTGTHHATVQLPDGAYTIRYNSEDLAGNIAPTKTFDVTIDATAPTATVKSGDGFTVGADGVYDMVSYKLYDAGQIDKVTINGVVKDLTNNAWSDVNFIKPGVFGAVKGTNTLVVYDVAGNTSTVTFTLN
jgi:hypothetical protein